MDFKINTITQIPENGTIIILCDSDFVFGKFQLTDAEINYLTKNKQQHNQFSFINQYRRYLYFCKIHNKDDINISQEELRRTASKIFFQLKGQDAGDIALCDFTNGTKQPVMAFAEGLLLSMYQFKIISEKPEGEKIPHVGILSDLLDETDIVKLETLIKAVFICRDWVNTPYSMFKTADFTRQIMLLGKEAGFSVEVFSKDEIVKLGMGGLLAVNSGSFDKPAFVKAIWKPQEAVNSQPLVLVGKGIVYDSGGMSLKPTKDGMDTMKSDMSGGAAVISTLYYIALLKIPVYVIALVPVTDNMPGNKAYMPGDVIKMYNGLHVEVLNTDAEGRLILADALAYSSQFNPESIIEISTLTGSARAALGAYAIAAMGNLNRDWFEVLKNAGEETWERLVEFPLWDEYGEALKSDIADLKNIGGKDAGAITAGKFLQHFAPAPFVHLDIAGTAFLNTKENYRGPGATGTGVRLICRFIEHYLMILKTKQKN